NSVDLAAYYGAMKQAEVLNAMAHVNYQIRQSWKLMAYRYRGIGMAGNEEPGAPFNPVNDTLRASASVDSEYKCPASFCINYAAFNIMNVAGNQRENYCRDMCKGMSITLPGQPFGTSLLAGLLSSTLPGVTAAVDTVSKIANLKVTQNCEDRSALNWYVLGRFIFAFKNDVANRKRIMNKLGNSLSYDEKDFKDIDGESVRTGALNTAWKNMTYQNQASIDPTTGTGAGGSFEFFNSLAAGGCGGTRDDEGTPPKWLQEMFVKPLYGFLDGICPSEASSVEFRIKIMNVTGDAGLPNFRDRLAPEVVQFIQSYSQDPLTFDTPEARMFHTTVGYEKNPWCMAYVKTSATTRPKIPFSPFGGVTLKATAYAKPFGGTIGPWFYKNWPQSADKSTGGPGEQVDKTLPPRVRPGEAAVNANDDFLRVDYSRYVGDTIGVKSTMTMGRMHKAIFLKNGPANEPRLSLTWYNHLMGEGADINQPSSHGDILIWNNGIAPGQRDVEIGAVIPDQFDIANYSIEPFWWRAYAQRIQKRSDFANIHVRGDLGYRRDAPAPWNTFSVKDQMARALADNTMDYNEALTYVAGRNKDPAKAFVELLTSWHTKVPGDYVMDEARFGDCADAGIIGGSPEEIEKAVPGNCMAGGRTGYSVKLIDEQFLITDQENGGAGNNGRIKNPPPGL
ncbi:MAG: hypothetical protein ACK5P7_00500, partial [Bdellovibrio sp.]